MPLSGAQKDTGRNVHETLAFTVNIVSNALLEGMNICAVQFGSGTDELAHAGLTAKPGQSALPMDWREHLPLRCRHHTTLGIGNSREIILGKIVYAHFRADTIDAQKHYVDPIALDAIGRMGGHGYATTRDYFDLPTMSVEAWRAILARQCAQSTEGSKLKPFPRFSGIAPRTRDVTNGKSASGQ